MFILIASENIVSAALQHMTRKFLHRPVCFSGSKFVRITLLQFAFVIVDRLLFYRCIAILIYNYLFIEVIAISNCDGSATHHTIRDIYMNIDKQTKGKKICPLHVLSKMF